MSIKSIELPGIGTKYEIETEKGDKVAVVFMDTGGIQLYILEKGKEAPSAAELNSWEARRLGSILTGAVIEPEEEAVEIAFSALSDLRISIHTYIIGRKLEGKSIGELAIRRKTGVTIIAVAREGRNVVNPPPSFTFEEGDIVVAIGEHHQLKAFESEILGI
jgi:TrkA domain protein